MPIPSAPASPAGHAPDRRRFLAWCGASGLGSTLFPGVLWARVQEAPITADVIAEAEKLAGLEFTPEEREMMVEGLNGRLEAYEQIRAVDIPNHVPPALLFDPQPPGRPLPTDRGPSRHSRPQVTRPERLEDVAFWSLPELAELVRSRQVSSMELTRLFLDRLRRHGPTLECVVTLTEERALASAARADAELANGRYRGPLHGIPWGAKDLLAVSGYPTTWGAKPFETQELDGDATVVRRLDDAGAVLVAKLTLGALAQGDVWFGGRTRNPWNLEQGSSGSSAGSASATVAGLVGFSIGSETLGSIVSPSTRCGASGHRPTFGLVSRAGAMALSWSMDKLGPICRTAEGCALVLEAIHGPDGEDPTVRPVPFTWDVGRRLDTLQVGYLADAYEEERETAALDRAALDAVRALGVEPIPVRLPDQYPLGSIRFLLTVEAAAAFDALTRSGRDDLLVRQDDRAWPNSLRSARTVPAVEYLQANRVRTMVMRAVDAALAGVDVIVTPSFGGNVLLTTNLTGHPTTVVPAGFREDGAPMSVSFVGQLWGDAACLRLAHAYQEATRHHRRNPEAFA